MTRFRHLLIRRLVTAIIAVSIGAFMGESLLAEVHEDGNTGGAVPSAVADGAQKEARLSPATHAEEGGSSDHSAPEDWHQVPVCHEAHTHAAALAAADSEAAPRMMQRPVVTATADLPASWSSGPLHRPPIG